MATVESGGAGGKFRKKPLRRQTTPYDRPATALRPTQVVGSPREKNSWLSKLVDPASRLITAGAHKLFSSVFHKRLLPPPPCSPGEATETGNVQAEITSNVAASGSKEAIVFRGNTLTRVSDSGGVAELEDILKQKTFTRSEIDHLTALLQSRTVDGLAEDEKGWSERNFSDEKAVHSRHEIVTNLPALENGAVHAAISSPVMRSKVVEDVVASPAELAKAYMGSRPTRASPSVLALQNEMSREDQFAPYNSSFKPKSPAMSLIQKPSSDIGASANGFMTPRFRGRSAIYSMGRTPYSRPHPTEVFKATETAFDVHGASSSCHNVADVQQLSGSKRQVLKRRSSVLESDIGFVGPIRRIRQKPNLLHHKMLSLPAASGAHVNHGSQRLADVSDVPSSIDWISNHRSSKALADTGMPSTSNGHVPSQSIETAEKIFQQLDKFTSKGKSPEKKVDVGGSSPGKMTSDMRDGFARKSMNTADTSKVLQTTQDSRKGNGLDSINEHDHSPKVSQRVEEGSLKKFVIPSVEDGAEAGIPDKVPDDVNPLSSFGHQQKKRAFQMSAHEDYLEPDDDVLTNGVASTQMIKGVESHELAKSSVAIFDNSSESAANSAGKTPVPEANPSTNLMGTNKEKSLPDGFAAPPKTSSLTFPVVPSISSVTSTSTQGAVSSLLSTTEMDEAATRSEKINETAAFSSNSAKAAPFSFSSPSTVQFAAVKGIKTELPSSATGAAAKADEPDKTDKNRTFLFADASKKVDPSSSVASSGKDLFSSGVLSNGATLSRLPSTVSTTTGVLSPVELLNSSNDRSPVPVAVSSPLFPFSNGNALSTSTAVTSAGAAINSPTAGIFSSPSTSITAAPVLFGSISQSGSSEVSSASGTAVTTALESAAKSEAKLNETALGNVTNSLFSATAKPSGIASVESAISEFSTSKTTSSETQTAAPAVSNGSTFGLQAPSTVAVSTPIQGLSSQSASAASSHGLGLSGPVSFNASASTFSNPFTSGSTSASNVSVSSTVTAPVSSSSNPTTGIFGWQSPKPTAPFGTSPSTGFTFGLQASGTSATNNSTPLIFGATSSSTTASNSAPFVFGSTSSAAASVFPAPPAAVSTPAASSTPFPSLPVFSSSTPQPFAFNSTTPVGNNDHMSMEDSMAEDSVQVSTPAASVFGAPMSAPSSSFVFGGAAPSTATANLFQFGGQLNQTGSQNTPFQASGSLELNAGGGGNFSVGSGGGDKSNRRIVKVRNRIRKK